MSAQISSRRFRKLLPRFETRVDAGERRDRLVKQLENGSRQERRVRRQLKRCRKASPCQLPMCPLCVRRLRRSFVKAGLICIDGVRDKCRPKDVPITAFSAVLTEEQYPAGDLVSADLQRTNERLQRRHLRCGFPLVFAGVDLSFNTPAQPWEQPYWQFQVYGIVIGLNPQKTRTRLEPLYPTSPNTPRPLHVKQCNDLAEALSYAIKPYFSERVNYRDDAGRMNTRTVTPKTPQIQELASWIRQYRLTDRYALTGARRYSDRIEAS